MITAPTAPSEFGTSVDDLAAAYSPQELQKRYKVTKELVYLLALQKLKSEMDAAQRTLAMSQQQTPGTVKQQLENQVMQGKMQEASGIMSQAPLMARQQQPQMAQRQPQMAAQGGIVGYQTGNQKADSTIATEADIASNFGDDLLQDLQENPGKYAADLALLGLMFVPGLGILGAAGTALRSGRLLSNVLPKLGRVFRGKPKQEIIEPKTQRDPSGRISDKKDLVPYDPKKDPTRPVDPGKQLAPRKPTPPSATEIGKATPGLAGIAGLVEDDAQTTPAPVDEETTVVEDVEEEQEDTTEPFEIKMREATDFQKKAQENALRVKDLSPALVGSLETQATMSPEKMDERRDAEAKRYLDKIGAEERTQGLQNLYDEQVAVLDAQADPDELRRRRQLAFFSNIGTGGIGSILRGGGRGLMKEDDAQRQEARDAAQTKITSYQSVHNFDISMIKDAEDKGLAILELDRLDKRNAQAALSNITRSDLTSINSYADRLRSSEDSRIQEQFQKLELLQNNYENLRKDERLDYEVARDVLGQIQETENAIFAIEAARLPEDVKELLFKSRQPGAQLTTTEQARVALAEQTIDMAIKIALNQKGLLDTKEKLIERVEAGLVGTRKSPVDPSAILGVGT